MLRWNLDAVIGGMPVNSSFFVPCIRCRALQGNINAAGKRFGVKMRTQVRFEANIKGVRAWRVE
jgi:hypothetical protein